METKYGINKGDEVLNIGPTTGVIELKVGEMHVGESVAEECQKGDLFSIAVPDKIRTSDKLYKWVNTSDIIKE